MQLGFLFMPGNAVAVGDKPNELAALAWPPPTSSTLFANRDLINDEDGAAAAGVPLLLLLPPGVSGDNEHV